MRRCPTLLAVAAAGCAPASVTVDGLDAFGPVASALLVERTVGDAPPSESIVLNNHAGYCEAFEAAITEQIAANRFYTADMDAAETTADQCAIFAGLLDTQARIWADIHVPGYRSLSIGLGEPGAFTTSGDALTASDGTRFYGNLEYYTGNPYAGASAQLDCDAEPVDLDYDTYEEHLDSWWLVVGDLALDREAGTMALTGAELARPMEASSATIEAEATLERCDIVIE